MHPNVRDYVFLDTFESDWLLKQVYFPVKVLFLFSFTFMIFTNNSSVKHELNLQSLETKYLAVQKVEYLTRRSVKFYCLKITPAQEG